jgi:CheY-like chemotaxis protein|tara:strand:- start:38976 stop:39488 length:513 start_codon:yes stop_codon:yes gene_type:complete
MSLKFEKLTVLVVDDTQSMRMLIVSVLEALDVGMVLQASNGEQGFNLFRQHNPDILLVDWLMEPTNGIELTERIRNDTESPNRMAPIILVTGYSARPRVVEARDAGVTEFLVKPFTATDLTRRLQHVINNPRNFIDYNGYFGPDRRRKDDERYSGPRRRENDMDEKWDVH